MPSLVHRVFGFPESSSGRRPQMGEFAGINWNTATALNMMACFPMWEPPGVPCFDLGPLRLIGKPLGTILRTFDPIFGDVYLGDNPGGGSTTRGYAFGYVEDLDFCRFARTPFSVSFWYKALSVNFSPAVDVYLMAFDNPSSTPTAFAGYACSFDSGGTIAFNTGSNTEADGGFKTTNNVFRDTEWHHFAFSHIPGGVGSVAAGVGVYYIDGRINNIDESITSLGAIGSGGQFYIGVDDDGVSQPFGGYFCDLRIYREAISPARAAQMYHPDTRWEIYYPPKRAFFLPVGAPSLKTATPGVATVTLSGIAPLASGTGTATGTPNVATVTLSGIAPAASGTGTAPTTPGVATVTLSAIQPTASPTGSAPVTPEVATVTVSAIAPSALGMGTATVTPNVATVTLSAIQPAASGTGTATSVPGVATVTLSAIDVTATTPQTGTPGVATITVSAVQPSALGTSSAPATPNVATVTLTATQPSALGTGTATVTPGVATVTISGVAVSASAGFATATPNVATVTLSGISPIALGTGTSSNTPGTATVTVSATQSIGTGSGTLSRTPGVASVTLSGIAAIATPTVVTISPGIATVSLSYAAPTPSGFGTGTAVPGVATVTVAAIITIGTGGIVPTPPIVDATLTFAHTVDSTLVFTHTVDTTLFFE